MDVMARSRNKQICLGVCLKPSIGPSYRKVLLLYVSVRLIVFWFWFIKKQPGRKTNAASPASQAARQLANQQPAGGPTCQPAASQPAQTPENPGFVFTPGWFCCCATIVPKQPDPGKAKSWMPAQPASQAASQPASSQSTGRPAGCQPAQIFVFPWAGTPRNQI